MSETREGAERKVLKRLKRKLLRGLAYLLCLVEVAMVGTIIRILWLRMHGQGGTEQHDLGVIIVAAALIAFFIVLLFRSAPRLGDGLSDSAIHISGDRFHL